MQRSAEEWLEILEDAGVPCAPILRRHEMIHHPQVKASEVVVEVDHEHAGRLRQTRNAARFEGTPTEMRVGAPNLGEHTAVILEELGYSTDEIESLLDGNVVAAHIGAE